MRRSVLGSMSTALTIQTLTRAEFACQDASCAPPPVGTGGSVPSASSLRTGKGFGGMSPTAEGRTRPKPGRGVDVDAFDLPSRSHSLARSVYEHQLPGGHRSEVDEVESQFSGFSGQGFMEIKGYIYDRSGGTVGNFTRRLSYDTEKRELSVEHYELDLAESAQGSGVGAAFNTASIAEYRSIGVDHIKVQTGLSVGGYAWAREGFRFDEGDIYGTGYDQLRGMVSEGKAKVERSVFSEPDIRYERQLHIKTEASKRANALVNAARAGEDVQPIHVASIGEDDLRYKVTTADGAVRETWPGKEMLMGQTWSGVYYLDAKNDAVTAAAAIVCEHGSLVAACYDASCRPPRSGGTGGSSKRGYKTGGGAGANDNGDVMPDVRLGGVRVTYDPDYPDGGPDPGEVVWAKVPFEDDPTQSKDRPVLIIGRVEGSTRLAAVQLTSQIKGRGWELPIGSGSWDRSGKPSAINMGRIIQVGAKNYRREGSKFDEKKFDAVIGRLAAFHRTPVNRAVTAAAAWLEEFYDAGQPRDKNGRWSRVGGKGTGDGAAAVKCNPSPCVKESIERMSLGRSVLHRRIVKEVLASGNPPPHVTILGGGGGAGKSTIVNKFGLGKSQATVNADDIKEKIPEYNALVKAGDMSAAAFVHEESSKIAKDVQAEARQHGVGVLLDQVGSNPAKVTAQVKQFVRAGYTDIDAVYVTVPTQVAVDRATARAQRSGRAVPEAILRAAHRDVSRGFEEIAMLPELRDVKLYDNTGSEPVLIASGGRGNPLVIHDRALYDQFLAKGEE
jgi:predicted ABC-type ATPase